ncbi:MAG TPA: AAA family ATPase [Gemmatimonadaceae bacterium]|nr:AAA family ATPase [Gemmatimonadaceae bacterium]
MCPRRPIVENIAGDAPAHGGRAPFLREVHRRAAGDDSRFPFSVPVIRTLDRLSLDAPVTFFVGENGSGKSTLLEGIAAAARLPVVGSADLDADATLGAQRELAGALRLVWSRKTPRGFFLRAEDFFGFAKRLSALRSELLQRIAELEVEYADRSDYARRLAMGPAVASLADMERRYGVDLDANSHGQSFLRLFQSRFVPDGLYLLDEPEAPLSPQSQLALMAMMQEMLAAGAQFVIATHSPILLAFPEATIYSFDRAPAEVVRYDELDHVVLTRDFLNAPERYLRALAKPG